MVVRVYAGRRSAAAEGQQSAEQGLERRGGTRARAAATTCDGCGEAEPADVLLLCDGCAEGWGTDERGYSLASLYSAHKRRLGAFYVL